MLADEDLYQAMKEGDARAFDELYQRYERRLLGFIFNFLRNREDAEDVFQETFQVIIKAARSRPGSGSHVAAPVNVSAWLHTVARNLCLNRLRARRAAALRVGGEDSQTPETAEERLLAMQRSDALTAAVTRLPPRLGEVYRLRARGQSYEDMAVELDVPIGTIKSRVHTLVRYLREEIDQWLAR
jgi:RNA polymerase sigma-70 factor (ECF subfamily)